MRLVMMAATGVLAAATAGMAHGETGNRSLKIIHAERAASVCRIVQNFPGFSEVLRRGIVDLPGAAADYFNYFEKQTKFGKHLRTTLLQTPKNGYLEGDASTGEYLYRPNAGFQGQDKVVALVELGEYRVKVVYFINVVMDRNVGDDEASISKYCGPKGNFWKISLPTTPP